MANYDLGRLGAQEFEHMVQALLKEVIGSGTITFGAGQDGAREATFHGLAPYPSTSTQWDGDLDIPSQVSRRGSTRDRQGAKGRS